MRRSFALLASTLVACASPAVKTTFADAGLLADPAPEREPEVAPPPAAPPPTDEAAAEAPAGPPIDADLVQFAAIARERRAALPRARAFPQERIDAWAALADVLARYLDRPLSQTPFAELARARVTLEAELDLDRRHFGAPPPGVEAELADRVDHLARRAAAARALGRTFFAARPAPTLRWPLLDAGLSSSFGPRMDPFDHVRRMHWGIDLAAASGRVVSAAAPGYVVHAGYRLGYGLVVEVRHDGDLTSRYGHLSHLLCAAGDRVDAGQPLGMVGATGRATGPHLHFEVWRGGRAEDPLALLGRAAVPQ